MLAIRGGGRKIEAEKVVASLLRAAMGPRERGAPVRLIRVRPVEFRLNGVVPVALPFRIGLDHVAESRHERGAAKSVRRGGKPRKAVISAHAVVADGSEPRSERLA